MDVRSYFLVIYCSPRFEAWPSSYGLPRLMLLSQPNEVHLFLLLGGVSHTDNVDPVMPHVYCRRSTPAASCRSQMTYDEILAIDLCLEL